MYFALNGKITHKFDNFIVLNVNNISYQINIIYPQNFKINQEMFVYIHHVINENEEYLIGFKEQKEKEAFLLLINVKNIGPKTAINILKSTTPELFLNAVNAKDIDFLKKLPRISTKIAQQIILDLFGKISNNNENNSIKYNQIYDALKKYGFKKKEIKKTLSNISINDEIDVSILLKEALSKINKINEIKK